MSDAWGPWWKTNAELALARKLTLAALEHKSKANGVKHNG